MEEVDVSWVTGFWKRVIALLIDTLVLGTVGFVLGLAFESIFVGIGAWGRLIGFSIAITYFGVMNSKLANGQTLGKRALKIKVVDSEGSTISLKKSLLRYSVLSIPFSLNGAQFSNEILQSGLMYLVSIIVFGGLFSTIYLYVFNRVTRQSFHDLVVGTFVVNLDASHQTPGAVWKPYLVVVAIFFISAGVVPAFTSKLIDTAPFKGLFSAQKALISDSAVKHAGVTFRTTTLTSSNDGTTTTTHANANISLFSNNIEDEFLAERFARIVMDNYQEARNKDSLNITLTYGYDIGIWSQWSNHTHVFNPAEYASAQ